MFHVRPVDPSVECDSARERLRSLMVLGTMTKEVLEYLLDRRSDPEARAVLTDYLMTLGHGIVPPLPLPMLGGGDGGYGGGGGSIQYRKQDEMNLLKGLRIVSIPSGYNPYVLIGWLRRLEGDEYELVGARVIRRYGTDVSLTQLAEDGPAHDTQLLRASAHPEPVNRLLMSRCLVTNEDAWSTKRAKDKACPRPNGWVDE